MKVFSARNSSPLSIDLLLQYIQGRGTAIFALLQIIFSYLEDFPTLAEEMISIYVYL